MMFEGLLTRDADGKIAPGIVKKWEAAPDGLSWTFNLRDDVFFQAGTNADGTAEPRRKLTAEDVAFNLEYNQIPEAQRGARWKAFVGNPPKTQIIDDYTIRIYTATPQPFLPTYSTHAILPHLWVVPKAYIAKNGMKYFRDHPIGTGPYKLVR